MEGKKTRGIVPATVCMGLALFASQFGAGNLIFPPFLGRDTGASWFTGFIGFFIMDVGLAALAVLSVVVNREGTVDGVVGKMGKKAGKILLTTIILCLGPCVCVPRTAATSYELGIKTLAPGIPQWLFGAIFFGIVLFLVIRPTRVVDIIGNYLTPLLLGVMVILIVIGIVHPIGVATDSIDVVPMKSGIESGYQTLDGIGGVLMTLMLLTAARGYGYKEKKDLAKMVAGADMISAVLLALVYGGLTYLGSTVSDMEAFAGLDQAPLLIAITKMLMGNWGVACLSAIVILACLTTALSLCSVAGNYFEELTNGKLKYKTTVIVMIIVSYAMSNFGLSQIIAIAGPILSLLYPPLIALVIAAFFDRRTTNDYIGGAAAYAALAASLLEVGASFGLPLNFIALLPFAEYGLGWVTPAIAGAVLGFLLGKVRKPERGVLPIGETE